MAGLEETGFPIDAVMRIVATGDMKAAREAIYQYAADVAASACMPLIEQNARLQMALAATGAEGANVRRSSDE